MQWIEEFWYIFYQSFSLQSYLIRTVSNLKTLKIISAKVNYTLINLNCFCYSGKWSKNGLLSIANAANYLFSYITECGETAANSKDKNASKLQFLRFYILSYLNFKLANSVRFHHGFAKYYFQLALSFIFLEI